MTNDWVRLQKKNAENDEIRADEQRETAYLAFILVPAAASTLALHTSGRLEAEFLRDIPFAGEELAWAGSYIASLIVMLAYMAVIAFFRWSFYKELSRTQSVLVAWVGWAWFVYANWFENSLTLAFGGLFVISLLAVHWVGIPLWGWGIIRERMFLRRPELKQSSNRRGNAGSGLPPDGADATPPDIVGFDD